MSTRADFTDAEWAMLEALPWVVGITVVSADPSFFGVLREFKATWQAISETATAGAAEPLVEELVAGMHEDDGEKHRPDEEHEDEGARMLAFVESVAAIVDERCDPAEASGLKRWALATARATAEAAKEGAVLGIGGVQVSAKERRALSDLRSALGLDPE